MFENWLQSFSLNHKSNRKVKKVIFWAPHRFVLLDQTNPC